MIPLRTSQGVARFPVATLVMILLCFVAALFIPKQVFIPQIFWSALWDFQGILAYFASALFFENYFLLIMCSLFFWVFAPRLFERRSFVYGCVVGLTGMSVAFVTYALIFKSSAAPVMGGVPFVGAVLGAFMRRDIWGTVNSVVVGPGWIRVYEVPSYVLLFFWFFYLFIGTLLKNPPYADAPMPYWLPFSAFLWGFLMESAWGVLRPSRESIGEDEVYGPA